MDSLIQGLVNFLGQLIYRIFMGTLFLYTGYLFLTVISLGRLPGRSSFFRNESNIAGVGIACWFAIAIGFVFYNDYQRSLW
jgi:uncharacterized membrane protein YphA (DoxX/SURF4 family)